MLFVLLSKRFLHMTVLDGFAFVAIHANLLDHYKNRIMDSRGILFVRPPWQNPHILYRILVQFA